MAAVLLVVVLRVVAGDLRVGGQGLQTGVEQSTVALELSQQLSVQLLALGGGRGMWRAGGAREYAGQHSTVEWASRSRQQVQTSGSSRSGQVGLAGLDRWV